MTPQLFCSSEKASAKRRVAGFFCFLPALFLAVSPPSSARQTRDSSHALRIRSIAFQGNNAHSSSHLRSVMILKEGASFSQEALTKDREAIVKSYRDDGFLFMSVDSISFDTTRNDLDVQIFIREGKSSELRSLVFQGNEVIDEQELLAEMASRVGGRFQPTLLEQDLQALLHRYEQLGRPFATASVGSVTTEERDQNYAIDVLILIDEGEAVRISELLVSGNTTTKTDVIVREARLHSNELFQPDMPELIQRRLQRTQLFSSVTLPVLFVQDDGTAGFRMSVTEGSPNRFDGVAGYIPATGQGESGNVTGLADVQFRNLFGTGRKLSVRWKRETQTTQEIELRYHEPWVASFPVNAGVGFLQRKQDSTYVRRLYDLAMEYMFTEEFRIGISFTQQDVIPSEGVVPASTAESRTASIGGYLFYDSRDDAVTPTNGFLYRMNYHTGSKKRTLAQFSASNSIQRFGLDFEYYHRLFSRQVVSVSVYAREFRSGAVELSDVYRVGGANTIRGYREAQFLGTRVAWSNFEYRFLAGQRSFLYLFADAGYVSSPDFAALGIQASEITRLGFGAGVRLDTAIGLIGISLAAGEGDTFSTAKIHLRLENEF